MRKRIPLWFIAVLLLAIVGIGVYAFLTTPLPFGLSQVIYTPGGAAEYGAAASLRQPPPQPGTERTAVGQPLTLGAVTITVQGVQRNQTVTVGGASGTYTLVGMTVANRGREPIFLNPTDFRLTDQLGRSYAVDVEATRAASEAARRRSPFEGSVSPGSSSDLVLAFATPPDATDLTLRATLGYGEMQLPG